MDPSEKDRLAQSAMKTVDFLVQSAMKRFHGTLNPAEIRSYALEGLADAIDRFDPDRNVSIGVFAAPRIRGAIYDGISDNSGLSRYQFRQLAFYRKSDDLLQHETDRPLPTSRSESVHRLADRLQDLACVYMAVASSDPDILNIADPVESNAEQQLLQKESSERIHRAIKQLPEKQQLLLHHFFYKDLSLSDIARVMGHTPSWGVRSLNSALRKLRRILQDRTL